MYNVTVRATEEMDSVGGGPAKAAELDVMVMVTDIDEGPGSIEVMWLQPEVGTRGPACYSERSRYSAGGDCRNRQVPVVQVEGCKSQPHSSRRP